MRILFFGDSITQGFWDPKGGWVNYFWENYNNLLINGEVSDPALVFNLGVSGDTTSDILSRFDQEVKARQYQNEELCIVFSVGVNNTVKEGDVFWSTPEDYKNELKDLYKKARNYSKKILFLGLTGCDEKRTLPVSWGNYWHTNERIVLFDCVLKDFCQDNNLPCVDLLSLFKGKEDELLFDGLHPNHKGHYLIYQKVKPELEKLLALH